MASATTYLDIQNRVLDLIGKSDATTRNRIKNWINMGYHNFVLRELWPFRETTGSLSLVADTQEYSLSSNFSDIDQQNILAVSLQGASARQLTYWPYSQLRYTEPDFDQEGSSLPTRYYLKSGNIGFWPTPNDAYSVSIDYYKIATELSSDSDEPIIPIAYRQYLVQFALSKEHDYNSDPDLAQKAMNEYEQGVTLARQNLLSQPVDNSNFQIKGPADFVGWTGLYSNERR